MRLAILILLSLSSFGLRAADSVELGDALFVRSLFTQYQNLHRTTLLRYLELESKSDGLSEDFRNLLADRKLKIDVRFKGKGKTLPDLNLLQAIITERKRLEGESAFIIEIEKSPLMIKQFEKKIASNMLLLESSEILLTYAEYLDEFNRGVRPLPQPPKGFSRKQPTEDDIRLMKILSATLTAFDYSKARKSQMALSNPGILKLNQKESQQLLSVIESGLGKMSEDSILAIPEDLKQAEKKKLEDLRLKNTKKLVSMLDNLAKSFILANKAHLDEYQYHILKLNQKLNESMKEYPQRDKK